MATYLVFARSGYADPLELIDQLESAAVPDLDDLDGTDHWLELVVFPADEVIWIQRDGELVGDPLEVTP